MSDRKITVVEHSDTCEIKVFADGELVGRYKTKLDAIAHLSTALVELTAAQSQVAELQNTSTIDNAYIDKLEMLLRRVRPYITVDCELATAIDGVLDGK